MDPQTKTVPRIGQKSKFEPVTNAKGERVPWLFRYTATGKTYVRRNYKKKGIKPLFEPLNETTLGRSITARDLAMLRHENRHLGISDDHVFGAQRVAHNVGEVCDWILKHHTPSQRPRTQEKHFQFMPEIKTRLGHRDINSLGVTDLADWVAELKSDGKIITRGKKSVVSYRKSFEDYAKHLNLVARIAHNELKWASQALKFKNPDKKTDDDPDKVGRIYTQKEIAAIWNKGFSVSAEPLKGKYASLRGPRRGEDLKDQFTLSYECMMRLREVLKLTWDRVDLKTGKITLRASDVKTGSKTKKGRTFIASPNALARLRARHKTREDGPSSIYVFPSPRVAGKPIGDNKTAWNLAKRRANLKGRARWHDLRHTAITEALLVKRVPPILVSEYAGVSLATIQKVYLHGNAEDTREVSGAIQITFKDGVKGV